MDILSAAAIYALSPLDFAHGVHFLRHVLPPGHKSRAAAVELIYQYQ
jgi:hypothetical protein